MFVTKSLPDVTVFLLCVTVFFKLFLNIGIKPPIRKIILSKKRYSSIIFHPKNSINIFFYTVSIEYASLSLLMQPIFNNISVIFVSASTAKKHLKYVPKEIKTSSLQPHSLIHDGLKHFMHWYAAQQFSHTNHALTALRAFVCIWTSLCPFSTSYIIQRKEKSLKTQCFKGFP